MSKLRKIKIQVGTTAQSEVVQRMLIDQHGCDWHTNGKTVRFTEAPYLYVNELGILSYSHDTEYFHDECPFVEVVPKFSWVYSVSIPDPVERDVVMYNGKKYYADVLVKALEGLEVK